MAKQDEQQRKLELLEQLSRQRALINSQRGRLVAQIAIKKEELKDKLNVPKRIKSSVRSSFSSSPTKWFIGSAVGGLILTKIFLGKSKRSSEMVSAKVSRGLLATSLIYIGKPFLKSFLLRQGKTLIMKRLMSDREQHSQLRG